MIVMSDIRQAGHVFILGKNWKLSLAELLSYLHYQGCKFRLANLSDFFVVVETERLPSGMIDDLGGTLKIGKVRSVVPSTIVVDAFVRREKQARTEIKSLLDADHVTNQIFGAISDKLVFGVSVYPETRRFVRSSREMQRFLGSYFKNELALQGTKAKFMGFPRRREFPQLTNVEVLKKELIEKSAEVLFCAGKEDAFVANTIAAHNPFEFQKRDVGRPVQRRIFSIPPRLARIMINLASSQPRKVLLDPFCGVGTILQEVLLSKAQAIGVDADPWCVRASTANLEWLKKEYALENAECKIFVGDARSLPDQIQEESVDCIVTEPELGPPLRDLPTDSYARKIVEKLEPLYDGFLREAYKVVRTGGRVVFVTPYIRTRKGSFCSLNIEEMVDRIGFKTVAPFEVLAHDLWSEHFAKVSSVVDIEERHKIGREIHILQK